MLIGGMFDVDVNLIHKESDHQDFPFYFDVDGKYNRKVYTNNGRTATTYVFEHGLKLPENSVVLVPEYNCISVFNALEAADVKFCVYRINENLIIDVDDLEAKITDETKVIYLIHYFGIPQPRYVVERIKELAKQYDLAIVEDLTQALLSTAPGQIGFGDYVVMSTRKWYPVTDGGVAAARDDVPFDIVELEDGYDEAVYRQMIISLERKYFEQDRNRNIQDYLLLEKEANKARYYDFRAKKMTQASQNIFFHCDHEESRNRRRNNYQFLWDHLQGMDGIEVFGPRLSDEDQYVPFGFVVMAENRDAFYDFLAARGVIGEIQWILPIQYYVPTEYATYMTKHSLMLQCDQRYTETEMQYVVDVIQEYFAEI